MAITNDTNGENNKIMLQYIIKWAVLFVIMRHLGWPLTFSQSKILHNQIAGDTKETSD